jgi:hypothetical protein
LNDSGFIQNKFQTIELTLIYLIDIVEMVSTEDIRGFVVDDDVKACYG